jgi:hypothetical protein
VSSFFHLLHESVPSDPLPLSQQMMPLHALFYLIFIFFIVLFSFQVHLEVENTTIELLYPILIYDYFCSLSVSFFFQSFLIFLIFGEGLLKSF